MYFYKNTLIEQSGALYAFVDQNESLIEYAIF